MSDTPSLDLICHTLVTSNVDWERSIIMMRTLHGHLINHGTRTGFLAEAHVHGTVNDLQLKNPWLNVKPFTEVIDDEEMEYDYRDDEGRVLVTYKLSTNTLFEYDMITIVDDVPTVFDISVGLRAGDNFLLKKKFDKRMKPLNDLYKGFVQPIVVIPSNRYRFEHGTNFEQVGGKIIRLPYTREEFALQALEEYEKRDYHLNGIA